MRWRGASLPVVWVCAVVLGLVAAPVSVTLEFQPQPDGAHKYSLYLVHMIAANKSPGFECTALTNTVCVFQNISGTLVALINVLSIWIAPR